MKVYFHAAVRDGRYSRTEKEFCVDVDDDASDDDIQDIVWDYAVNNLLEIEWRRASDDY